VSPPGIEASAERFDQLSDRLHLWVAETRRLADEESARSERMLSTDERDRCQRYLRPADRALFLLAHVAVRSILSTYSSIRPDVWTFETRDHGRPEITNAEAPKGLRFNLSHTEGMIAVLVHRDVDAGVDVERMGRVSDHESVARSSFSAAEFAAFMELPTAQRELAFTRLWTLKEAFIKATGMGLATGLKRFSFVPTDLGSIGFTCDSAVDVHPDAWSFTTRSPSASHVVATACRPGIGTPARAVDVFNYSFDEPG